MANRKRDVQILLWVTPKEKKMIRKRMILSKTSNMSVYLRKMAINGMIINTDTTYCSDRYFPVSISLYSLNTIFTIGSKSFFSGME